MASTSAVNLDTVLINIESNAGKVGSNISKLAKHLESLRGSIKGGFNNLNKLADALERLSKSTEKLSNTATNLKSLDSITKSLSQLKDIKSPTGLKNTVESLAKIPEIINQMDTKTFDNLSRVSNELATSLTPLADKMQSIADGYSAFSKVQNTFGKSASTVTKHARQHKSIFSSLLPIVKKLGSSVSTLGKHISTAFGKTAYSHLKKFHSKSKQIFLSLLGTRTLFTMIRKAAAEYEAFDQTLQDFSQNVWRAFSAQLAPVLYSVMDLFKQFVRVIYSVVLALTGVDLIARANEKAMASWGKSAEDTLGNLQKFDDLNVVEFPKDEGDDNKLIELDKIDLSPIQKVIDWVRKLKAEIIEAWNSGEWYGVGEVLAEGINMGIAATLNNINMIRDKFFEIGRDFGDFLNGVIQNTNWSDVGKFVTESLKIIPDFITEMLKTINWESLGKGINDFFKGFNAVEIVNSIGRALRTALSGLGTVLAQQDWGEVGKNIGNVLKTIFTGLGSFIDEIPWENIGEKIRETILGINWSSVWDSIVSLITESFKGLGEFLQGLFGDGIDTSALAGAGLALGVLVGGIALLSTISSKAKPGDMLGSVGDGVKNLLSSLGKAAGVLAILGGLALVLQSLASVLTAFSTTGMTAGDGMIFIIGIFGGLAVAMLGLQTAFSAMDWSGIAAGLVMLAGISAVFATLSMLLDSIAATGMTAGETMGVLAVVMGSVILLIAAMTLAATALQNPLAMAGVLVVVAAIAAVMFTLKETLPTILDACSKFINDIAPFIIQLVTVIGVLINEIIKSLGTILPPIINSVGNLFTTVFNGVSKVIDTVGNTIVKIMNTAASLVERVLNAILNFINKLGPAINTFVDNAISAVTKLINFIVSAVEYLINTAIIKPINKLINKINNNAIAEKLGWQIGTLGTVSIDRFAPKLETGTNEVPYEGIYHLHPGEAVVPKKYNPALGNGNSDEMNAKMDTLIELMSNMNFTNVVNIGNKKVYEGQQAYNKMQQNKYGTTNLY